MKLHILDGNYTYEPVALNLDAIAYVERPTAQGRVVVHLVSGEQVLLSHEEWARIMKRLTGPPPPPPPAPEPLPPCIVRHG